MRVPIDECIECRLAEELPALDVKPIPQMEWATSRNGKLLAPAANEFEVCVTMDENVFCQQDLPNFDIAVVVICAQTNRIEVPRQVIPAPVETC